MKNDKCSKCSNFALVFIQLLLLTYYNIINDKYIIIYYNTTVIMLTRKHIFLENYLQHATLATLATLGQFN